MAGFWKKFSQAPLWRIVLSYLALIFALHRGAALMVLEQTDAGSVGVWILFGLQVAIGLFLFVALRWYERLILPGLMLAGGLLAATALLRWGAGNLPPTAAATRVLIAVLGTAAFAALVRLGLRDDARERDQRS